jgi:hypothetical protein
MRTSIVKVVGACFALLAVGASASGLADYEATCSEIGFKKRTPAYGECVLELDQRATAAKGKPMQPPKQSQEQAQSAQGDGTPDHQTCSQFGFVAGTPPYSDCRLKVDIAKREQAQRQLAYEADQRRYQAEQRQYEQRLAAYEKEKERQKSLAMIRFGLAMAGGTSPNFSENAANAGRESLGMAPVPPTRPQMQNFSITGPSGRMTNCTVVGNNINCF